MTTPKERMSDERLAEIRKLEQTLGDPSQIDVAADALTDALAEIDALRAELTAARAVDDGEVAAMVRALRTATNLEPNLPAADLLTRLSAAKAKAERERDEALAALAQAREDLTGLELRFAERAEGQRQWISENAPYISHDQKHWHYGYCIALGDVAGQIKTTLAALTPTQEGETP